MVRDAPPSQNPWVSMSIATVMSSASPDSEPIGSPSTRSGTAAMNWVAIT